MIKYYKEKGLKTVLDASGENLAEGLRAKPTVIKPNVYELEQLFDTSMSSLSEVVHYAKKVTEMGIQEVLITMGNKGSLLVSGNKVYLVEPIKVKAINTVGAGDSFLAGYVYGMFYGMKTEERLQYATSVAVSSVLYEGTGPKDLRDIKKYLDKVVIKTRRKSDKNEN